MPIECESLSKVERYIEYTVQYSPMLLLQYPTCRLRRWGLESLMWERSCHGGRMIIHDSNGVPVNQIDVESMAKEYGSPIFQGELDHRRHAATAKSPSYCLLPNLLRFAALFFIFRTSSSIPRCFWSRSPHARSRSRPLHRSHRHPR